MDSFPENTGTLLMAACALLCLASIAEVRIRMRENRERLGNVNFVPQKIMPALLFAFFSAVAAIYFAVSAH